MSGGHEVELEGLAATGGEFVELADGASAAQAEFAGSVARHEGANAGFTSTSTHASLVDLWEFQIDDLGKRTAVAGGLLQDSSSSYAELETAVTETLSRINLGGGG